MILFLSFIHCTHITKIQHTVLKQRGFLLRASKRSTLPTALAISSLNSLTLTEGHGHLPLAQSVSSPSTDDGILFQLSVFLLILDFEQSVLWFP